MPVMVFPTMERPLSVLLRFPQHDSCTSIPKFAPEMVLERMAILLATSFSEYWMGKRDGSPSSEAPSPFAMLMPTGSAGYRPGPVIINWLPITCTPFSEFRSDGEEGRITIVGGAISVRDVDADRLGWIPARTGHNQLVADHLHSIQRVLRGTAGTIPEVNSGLDKSAGDDIVRDQGIEHLVVGASDPAPSEHLNGFPAGRLQNNVVVGD